MPSLTARTAVGIQPQAAVGDAPDGVAAGRAEDGHVPRSLVRCAVLGLLIATPVAVWWHVGQLSMLEGSNITANVLFRPPSVSEATETALGRTATALVAASAAALVIAERRGLFDRRWWRVLVPLLLLGAFIGAFWRVVTATTPGWDIGSTLLGIFVAVPAGAIVMTVLAIWACLGWASLQTARREERRRPRS
jgi:hypothetical protein